MHRPLKNPLHRHKYLYMLKDMEKAIYDALPGRAWNCMYHLFLYFDIVAMTN